MLVGGSGLGGPSQSPSDFYIVIEIIQEGSLSSEEEAVVLASWPSF